MYVPNHTRVDDPAIAYDFLDRYSFAVLTSTVDGELFATHLPLLLDRDREVLHGHVAKANPHWRSWDGHSQALAVFTGPHAYVTPSWYEEMLAVPTWNYLAVHVYGQPKLLADEITTREVLRRSVAKYEAGFTKPWSYELPYEYEAKMLRAIVAFEMPISRLQAKFKLSQNRSVTDRQRVATELAAGDEERQAVAAYMRRHVLS